MRKVMVSKWKWSGINNGKKEEIGEAFFHQFGVGYKEFWTAPPMQFTVAIIEWPDGQVESVGVSFIRFLEPPELPLADQWTKEEVQEMEAQNHAPLQPNIIDEKILTKISPAMIKELEDLLKTVSHNDLTRDSEDCALEAAIYILKRLV